MADENNVNKSNKPINGKLSRIETERLESVQEWGPQLEAEDRIKRAEERLQKAQAEAHQLEQQYAQATSQAARNKIIPKYQAAEQRITFAEEALDQRRATEADREAERIRNINANAASAIATYTKEDNVNQRTTTMAGKQRFFSQIQQDIRSGGDLIQAPTEVIEQRIRERQQKVAKLGQVLAGRTRGLGEDEWSDDMKSKAAQIKQLQEDTALDKRLIKVQVKEGMTTEKRQYAAKDVMTKAGSFLDQKRLEQEVKEGSFSLEQETDKLGDMFERLSKSLERFEDASENATDAQGNLTDEYKQASKELQKIQAETDRQRKLVGEIKRQGGGDDGLASDIAAIAAQFSQVGVTARNQLINQPTRERNLRADFMNIANQQYFAANKAVYEGDIESMEDVLSQKYFTRDKANSWKLGDAVTRVISTPFDALGDVVRGTLSGTPLIGLGQGLDRITKPLRGISAAEETTLPIYESMRKLTAAERKVRVHQMQTFYSHGRNLYNQVTGMGNANAIAMRGELADSKTVMSLASVGIRADQIGNLAQAFAGEAGVFDPGTMKQALTRAGRAKQAGQLGTEEYMSLAGQLVGAGGNPDELEDIIAAATARGMDNSKTISQMVSGTMALSSTMASLGVGGTATTGNMLAASTQKLVDAKINKNLAVGMATSSIQSYNNLISEQGMNFGNIAERADIIRMFPNSSHFQRTELAKLTSEQQMQFLKAAKDPNSAAAKEAASMAKSLGIDELLMKDGKFDETTIRKLMKSSMAGGMINVGLPGTKDTNLDSILDKVFSGKGEFTAKEMAAGRAGGFDLRVMQGAYSDDPEKKGPEGKVSGWRSFMTAAQRMYKEYAEGEKAAGNFERIEQVMKEVSEAFDPAKFGDEVADAGKNFTVASGYFKTATAEFTNAVANFVAAQQKGLKAAGDSTQGGVNIMPLTDEWKRTQQYQSMEHSFRNGAGATHKHQLEKKGGRGTD